MKLDKRSGAWSVQALKLLTNLEWYAKNPLKDNTTFRFIYKSLFTIRYEVVLPTRVKINSRYATNRNSPQKILNFAAMTRLINILFAVCLRAFFEMSFI